MGEEERESTLENKLWKKPLGTPSSRSLRQRHESLDRAGAGVTSPLLARPGVSRQWWEVLLAGLCPFPALPQTL